MKSLSLQRNFNSETNSRAFKRQIRLKDSFVNADSSPQYMQDAIFNWDDKARRAKSIAKRPMQHQRNVPQTITSRHKNISSANAYLLSQNIRMQNMINDSWRKPEERFSDSKLLSFNKKSFIMEKRNKQFIKPFWLIQQSNLIGNINLNQTINKAKIGEFTLPDIFSKESIQPSTEGTENSYIECQHLSWDSDEDKDPIQSVFLTKLENSLCTKPTTHTNGKFIALGKLAFCLIVYVSIYLIK